MAEAIQRRQRGRDTGLLRRCAPRNDGEVSIKWHGLSWLLVLLATSGCSSIIEGTSQEITINTTPPGAACGLYRQDTKIGEVTASPGVLLVKKSKYDIVVVCLKDGYQQAIAVDRSGTAGASVANLALNAGIGWAVDSVSGADNKYDSPIQMTLLPAQAAATAPPARLAGATPPE